MSEIPSRDLTDDQRFFERHPDRRHRVRRAYRAEEKNLNSNLEHERSDPALVVYVMVRRMADDQIEASFFQAPRGARTDLSEGETAALFKSAAAGSVYTPLSSTAGKLDVCNRLHAGG